MSIFIVIFVLYANRFVMRHRQHEFALNMILGMERNTFVSYCLLKPSIRHLSLHY